VGGRLRDEDETIHCETRALRSSSEGQLAAPELREVMAFAAFASGDSQMDKPAVKPPPLEPVVLPDVATEPHPTAHAIPEPPGTDEETRQEVVSDVKEANQPAQPRP
jgi:hypothetical protein